MEDSIILRLTEWVKAKGVVQCTDVIKASFAGAALNHYTCTNLLIYLRAVGVAVHTSHHTQILWAP